jgi:hypothetical protein
MGLSIGQTGTDPSALRAAAEDRAGLAERPVPSEPADEPQANGGPQADTLRRNNVTQSNLLETNEANTFARADRIAPVSAGFGDNTLSVQGAALVTVGTNLRRAREIVPTVQELSQASLDGRREQATARAETEIQGLQGSPGQEAGATVPRGTGAEATRRIERFRPEAAPQVRSFTQPGEPASATRSTGAPAPDESDPAAVVPNTESLQTPAAPRVGPGLTAPEGAVTTNQLDILI